MGWDSPLLPGELGIIQSHVKLAEDAIRNGYQNVLILEDDVEFSLTFSIDFMMWQEEVPDDWQMLYLGANLAGWNPNKGVHSEHVVNGYHLFAAHALGLRLNVLEDVYFSHYQDKAIDVWYAENSVYHKPYLFIPRMAWQRASYSDIQNEDVSYGFLRRGQWGVDS
jgi:GR25 family glycosyltransferase involved in LPS biosynthesis